jgi:arylsulfatase A-like enzyme
VITLDWLPTFLEAAGGKPGPDDKLDGLSLLPLLKDPAATLPARPLFWRSNGPQGPIAIRDGDWKLVHLRGKKAGAKPELYQLSKDIAEATDQAAAHPDKVKELQAKLAAWESTLATPLW